MAWARRGARFLLEWIATVASQYVDTLVLRTRLQARRQTTLLLEGRSSSLHQLSPQSADDNGASHHCPTLTTSSSSAQAARSSRRDRSSGIMACALSSSRQSTPSLTRSVMTVFQAQAGITLFKVISKVPYFCSSSHMSLIGECKPSAFRSHSTTGRLRQGGVRLGEQPAPECVLHKTTRGGLLGLCVSSQFGAASGRLGAGRA